ncbi:pitrilysin family protein [Rhodohalobacter sp.]|uniref:M16 family metallopeptidase n=1 Tax=Rhodohalobacter sp. TaxID=1974210 RepID=UPI002ACE0A28|nr:pitrilysin family protein [Rhodohalobacter sp.]MDZ7755446.1 pitrilysin family protein [Rhodohalobacter sp.]
MTKKNRLLTGILFVLAMPAILFAQGLETFEEKVTEFTLDNGLHFIVIERPVAPVASFVTFVNVGSVNEPVGNTGVAHIFEHMAFKGTKEIGTTNWEKESTAITRADFLYRQWVRERSKPNPDQERVERLKKRFDEAVEEADQYVVSNEFTQIIEQNGGTGLNAFTSADATGYFYSLPENRAELWFSLESDRFLNPVFREFFAEKDVVMEERRMRTDSNPVGRLIEEFLSVAYSAHPYKNPVIGWSSDIQGTSIEDAKNFYNQYYTPSNITIAIAGDVDPTNIKDLAETYFGRMESGQPAPEVITKEPDQRGERRFVMVEESQPFFLSGYHTVSQTHPDFAALQLVGAITSQGRTSRLYKRLVEDEQMALAVQAFNGFPGTKYPGLFMTLAVPNQGVSLEEVEAVIEEEFQKVKDGDITQEELDRAITNARASQVRSLNSNMGLALGFAESHAQRGSWKESFNALEALEAVTLDDLQRVAQTYFVKENRTVGMIKNESAEEEEVAINTEEN